MRGRACGPLKGAGYFVGGAGNQTARVGHLAAAWPVGHILQPGDPAPVAVNLPEGVPSLTVGMLEELVAQLTGEHAPRPGTG
jgi:hypothetical protein